MAPLYKKSLVGDYTLPQTLADELEREHRVEDAVSTDEIKQDLTKNEYQQRKYQRQINVDLNQVQSYKEIMAQRDLEREEKRVQRIINEKKEDGYIPLQIKSSTENTLPTQRVRKRRWDVSPEEWEEAHSKKHNSVSIVPSCSLIVNGIPLTDQILDKILPLGYKIVPFPESFKQFDSSIPPDTTDVPVNYYVPPSTDQAGLSDKSKLDGNKDLIMTEIKDLEYFKEEDAKYFGKLATLDESEAATNEVKFMKLLLKVKNGSPIARKRSLRLITDNARKFGPQLIFNQVLPILLEPNLDDQERHLLVKLIGRVLFQLDDLIRPYTHKILVVVAPLLIDEDFTTRLEARDIVSNLAKAAGLSNMISSLRPDLDHVDEFVRNTTSRVFAIVANTLGLVNFLPFLKAVIKSKKNWMARHTGIKIVQQLCINLGGGNGNTLLPYMPQLIDVLKPGLTDEVLQVRTMTALALSQLAESVNPYGIESFEVILEPTWLGLKRHRGKGLASFLKCIGSIIPLMCHDPNYEEYANYYTRELMNVISREFQSPDEDMKKSILRIMSTLPLSKASIPEYQLKILEPFLKFFWNRRVASDSNQLSRLVVDATTQLAVKFDLLEVLESIVVYSKDENESLRKMSVEAINKMIVSSEEGLLGLDSQLELSLVDGVLFAFQEQTIHLRIYLQALGTVANTLGVRLRPHMDSIISTILYRLKNKTPEIRQQASDLVATISPVIKVCYGGNDEILTKLILILYESLGEVYPEVLGSILSALHACIESIDKSSLYTMLNPSVNQILPTLTPILKNRQDKVQEACIKLVGLIARKNAESINAKEWMRVCFELLDMLKSSKKRIRVAANDTFGHIAKTIGPQDVLAMLLNNLRVQERQLRVCTAVAIGIVAETCSPFTVLPALMNEYRTPDNNVQNGVLKALSFLFEYIDGTMTKDYLFAMTPLMEDALTNRDLVHRQTASTVVKNMAINCVGLSHDEYADVFVHYLNLLLPNIYETSPHVISRILESMDSLRINLGSGIFMNYVWAGLFHPAKKVRGPYWKLYNRAYIQNSDILVPSYPTLDDLTDEYGRSYEIEELNLVL